MPDSGMVPKVQIRVYENPNSSASTILRRLPEFTIRTRKRTIRFQKEDPKEESVPPPSFPELELEIKDESLSLIICATPMIPAHTPLHPDPKVSSLRFVNGTHLFDPTWNFTALSRIGIWLGICQREVTTFYPALLENKSNLRVLIREFFVEHVKHGFEYQDYTFDVYVTRDERVKIVDFNPWGVFTLPLLFDWEELEKKVIREKEEGEEESGVELRIVESQCGVGPGLKTAVPHGYLDASPVSDGVDDFMLNSVENKDFEILVQADVDWCPMVKSSELLLGLLLVLLIYSGLMLSWLSRKSNKTWIRVDGILVNYVTLFRDNLAESDWTLNWNPRQSNKLAVKIAKFSLLNGCIFAL
ncbi:hypothetical protein FEM48_Zijuj01G0002800 [Ziziphus jujuba var. spinosa]|uniref:Cell division cycle protein 123 homolog n=1 Tax=Ziziphus jujuba var. spinosa TaxID=714518 RepID=A0A978VY15_ZIZJJ|nr:hypothetical protein FEM48_Zijuj01G0002800 [Ziziphus jujuba var. spinosa]